MPTVNSDKKFLVELSLMLPDLIEIDRLQKNYELEVKMQINSEIEFQLTDEEQAEIDRFCVEYGCDVKNVDGIGKTLLHKAASEWRPAVVRFLVSRGADVNAKDNQGFTPLHSAASNEDVEVIEFLVSKRADVNAEAGGG
jgi:ankyrin repeat protein